jgi:protein required for attachment to host cells
MKATKTLIVVADSGHVRYYINNGPQDGLHQVGSDDHMVIKTSAMEDSERGRTKNMQMPGRMAYESSSDPRNLEKQDFLHEVAVTVNEAARRNDYDQLVIAAPPQSLGMLREAIDNTARKKIVGEIAKDLTKENEQTLPAYIADTISLRIPGRKGVDPKIAEQMLH